MVLSSSRRHHQPVAGLRMKRRRLAASSESGSFLSAPVPVAPHYQLRWRYRPANTRAWRIADSSRSKHLPKSVTWQPWHLLFAISLRPPPTETT